MSACILYRLNRSQRFRQLFRKNNLGKLERLLANDPVSRREKVEAMLREDPRDTFLRYRLAMELDKSGEHAASEMGELVVALGAERS